jgi:hypothetical protein
MRRADGLKTSLTLRLVWLNVAGAAAYLMMASRCWLEPELAGVEVARGGDAVAREIDREPKPTK